MNPQAARDQLKELTYRKLDPYAVKAARTVLRGGAGQ